MRTMWTTCSLAVTVVGISLLAHSGALAMPTNASLVGGEGGLPVTKAYYHGGRYYPYRYRGRYYGRRRCWWSHGSRQCRYW
jgi:hypothetical protein